LVAIAGHSLASSSPDNLVEMKVLLMMSCINRYPKQKGSDYADPCHLRLLIMPMGRHVVGFT